MTNIRLCFFTVQQDEPSADCLTALNTGKAKTVMKLTHLLSITFPQPKLRWLSAFERFAFERSHLTAHF